eukprot:1373024-Pleurochrysis_carterae.AAC.2
MAAMFREPEILKEALSVRTTKSEPSIMELMTGAQLLVLPINDKARRSRLSGQICRWFEPAQQRLHEDFKKYDDPNEHSGGSHWSLLCYRNGCFEHYDSHREQNAFRAKEVARCLGPLLGTSTTPKVVQMAAPQQSNGYDCGMYVLAIAKKLCSLLLEDELPAVGEVHISIRSITPLDISRLREQFYNALQAQ